MTKILKINGLEKTYKSGQKQLTVLKDISFDVEKGQTFSIVGPSGSGKTTLCESMLMEESNLSRAVTSTTRKPRRGEKDRIDYHFFDHATFEEKIEAGEFYEYARVHDNLYGTLKSDVQEKLTAGRDMLLVIDVQGANSLRKKAITDELLKSRLITVFILPSSIKELEKRLRERATEEDDEIRRRLAVATEEMKQFTRYDYCLKSSSRKEDFENLRTIYRAEKMRNR